MNTVLIITSCIILYIRKIVQFLYTGNTVQFLYTGKTVQFLYTRNTVQKIIKHAIFIHRKYCAINKIQCRK